ncbi:MAG: DNA polymerase III subunit gamma/tau [Pseudomonadota bacterium]
MSYLVLARKYRPAGFGDVVGQEHVLRALSHALDNQRLHHAYLFSGTRGVGKTTLARILAKALNCETGVTSTPCGVCSACKEIDSGRFVDLIEVDAASRTKVDDTRELLDNVQYAATRGRYKVYLIDEVHMLSTHSFNALLKTLEEPPEHVKFLLATTDPQKLPVTVLSRCLQFNLKRIPPQLIVDRLAEIAAAESIEAEAGALRLLARGADGSLRDGLSLMDQAIAFGDGALSESDVSQMLGALDDTFVLEILDALIEKSGVALAKIVARADERVADFSALLDDLARALTAVALQQAQASDAPEEGAFPADQYADKIAPELVQLYYQIAIHGRRDLPLAPDARTGMEMALLRMLAFTPNRGQPQQSENAPDDKQGPAAMRPVTPEAVSAVVKPKASVASQTDAKAESAAEAAEDDPSREWYRLVGSLELDGVVRMLAANCAWQQREGQHISLTLDKRSGALLTDARVKVLESALSEHYGQAMRVTVTIAGEPVATDTPVAHKQREVKTQQTAAVETLKKDAGVTALQELMGAELDPGSVRSGDTTQS